MLWRSTLQGLLTPTRVPTLLLPHSVQNLAAPCVPCRYVVTQKHIGDTMRLKVLRDGKVQELEVRQACCARSAQCHCTAAFPMAACSAAPTCTRLAPAEGRLMAQQQCNTPMHPLAKHLTALPACVHPPFQITLSAYQYLVPPHLRESKPR